LEKLKALDANALTEKQAVSHQGSSESGDGATGQDVAQFQKMIVEKGENEVL